MAVVTQENRRTPIMAASGSRDFSRGASLYVGDLHPDVTEGDLIEKFAATVPVASVRLCRCSTSGKSLCYGYVNFHSYFNAFNALACLNHTDLKGKPMRLMWSQRDPSQRQSGFGNLFVKNLNSSINSLCLERIFSPFGTMLSCKVAEENGKSKGFGYVHFSSEQSARAARNALHGSVIDGMKLFVAKFIKRTERRATSGKQDFTNLYVKNLAENVTEGFLFKLFSPYGRINNVVVMRDDTGKSRGFGFVNFFQPENAEKAAKTLNGAMLGSKILFVGRAQNKAERTKMLQQEYKENFTYQFAWMKGSNLYVKNLSESIDETRLRELFGRYGQIISAKVMRHQSGQSRAFGFVCFSKHEESMLAKRELNGVLVDGKHLIVRVAERKEDRLKSLQRCCQQIVGPVTYGYLPRYKFVHSPVTFSAQPALPPLLSSYAGVQPLLMGHPSTCVGTQPFLPNFYCQTFAGHIPIRQGQPEKGGNTHHNKGNQRKLVQELGPSADTEVAGNTSDMKIGSFDCQKHGLNEKRNGCTDAETSSRPSTSAANLEEATSVLKAILRSPNPVDVEAERPIHGTTEAKTESSMTADTSLPKSSRHL